MSSKSPVSSQVTLVASQFPCLPLYKWFSPCTGFTSGKSNWDEMTKSVIHYIIHHSGMMKNVTLCQLQKFITRKTRPPGGRSSFSALLIRVNILTLVLSFFKPLNFEGFFCLGGEKKNRFDIHLFKNSNNNTTKLWCESGKWGKKKHPDLLADSQLILFGVVQPARTPGKVFSKELRASRSSEPYEALNKTPSLCL